MTTHSSILAWVIPRTQEPGRLQSIWWQRVETEHAHRHKEVHRKASQDVWLFFSGLDGFSLSWSGYARLIRKFRNRLPPRYSWPPWWLKRAHKTPQLSLQSINVTPICPAFLDFWKDEWDNNSQTEMFESKEKSFLKCCDFMVTLHILITHITSRTKKEKVSVVMNETLKSLALWLWQIPSPQCEGHCGFVHLPNGWDWVKGYFSLVIKITNVQRPFNQCVASCWPGIKF